MNVKKEMATHIINKISRFKSHVTELQRVRNVA